jgi:hypothetical protein
MFPLTPDKKIGNECRRGDIARLRRFSCPKPEPGGG